MRISVLVVFLVIILSSLSARGMYINNLLKNDIAIALGDSDKENKLLATIRDNGFTEIIICSTSRSDSLWVFNQTLLYDILTNNSRNMKDNFRDFLIKARDTYGIVSVGLTTGASAVNEDNLDYLIEQFNEYAGSILINALVTEQEYWRYDTDSSGITKPTNFLECLENLQSWRNETYSLYVYAKEPWAGYVLTEPEDPEDSVYVAVTWDIIMNNCDKLYYPTYDDNPSVHTDGDITRINAAYNAATEDSGAAVDILLSIEYNYLFDWFTENQDASFSYAENYFIDDWVNVEEQSIEIISGFQFCYSKYLQDFNDEVESLNELRPNCYVKGTITLPEESYQNTTLYFDKVNEEGAIIVEDETGIKIDSNGDFYKILHGNQFGYYQIRIDFNGEVTITDLAFNENQEEYDLGIINLNSETVVYYVYSNIPIENATANFTNAYNNEIRETQTIDLIKGWNKLNFTFPGENPSNYYCNLIASGVANETYSINSSHNYIFNNETDCYENSDIEFCFDNKLLHSGWNWESFPKLDRSNNEAVNAVDEFETFVNDNDNFIWDSTFDLSYNIHEYHQWSDNPFDLLSSDGGKLKTIPAENREYVAQGSRLNHGTEVELTTGWNWIGYWLPHSEMIDVAFGDNYDKVEKIKSEDWYFDKMENERSVTDPEILPSAKLKPLHYGEGYYVYLKAGIPNFQWYLDQTSRSKNYVKKEPDNFFYTKKADYEVIDVVDIDPEIQEIGVFENRICVGGVKVDENSEQILIYSDRMNRETSKFTFEVITGRGDSQAILDYKIYNANEGDFAEGVILSGHQDYSIVKLGKRGENNDVPVIDSIIHSSYPNPFNPKTTISFDLPRSEIVDISIFNIKGQKVITLVSSFKEQGSHSVVWNGNDANGKTVGSGIFFYKIKTANETAVSKLLMLK